MASTNAKVDSGSQERDVGHESPAAEGSESVEKARFPGGCAHRHTCKYERRFTESAGRARYPSGPSGQDAGRARNSRKRAAKEQEDFRSLRHTDTVEKFRSGAELIYNQLKDALHKIGPQEIPLEGERFDPTYQHAVAVVDTPDAEDNQVLEVLQRGYKLRDRVLPPAMVRVARKPKN